VGALSEPGRSRLHEAEDLVLADVGSVLGPDVVVVADEPAREHPAWVNQLFGSDFGYAGEHFAYEPGEIGAVGLVDHPGSTFAQLVVNVAETIQEAVIESRRFYGAAFPECPEHPNTPLWPELRDGSAMWACIDGGTTAVAIGSRFEPGA
jgi:hypothetical protein